MRLCLFMLVPDSTKKSDYHNDNCNNGPRINLHFDFLLYTKALPEY